MVLESSNHCFGRHHDRQKQRETQRVFQQNVLLIIKSIETDGVTGLDIERISDIAIDGKKILGSSMYKRKDTLFYHAVLNFAVPASLIERYLRHPFKEPDYREPGRVAQRICNFTSGKWLC